MLEVLCYRREGTLQKKSSKIRARKWAIVVYDDDYYDDEEYWEEDEDEYYKEQERLRKEQEAARQKTAAARLATKPIAKKPVATKKATGITISKKPAATETTVALIFNISEREIEEMEKVEQNPGRTGGEMNFLHRIDFIPLKPTEPSTILRLLSFQNVEGLVRHRN